MRLALFYHSVISDWNHGNAHFLRGLMRALVARGHDVVCYERADNWSLTNLRRERADAVAEFERDFPDLRYRRYAADAAERTVDEALAGADAVLVHEWNEPDMVARIGLAARARGVRSVFHDTHYRVVLDGEHRARLGLRSYQTIVAYSSSLAERYRALGFDDVRVLHEGADTSVFAPRDVPRTDDVVFIGNWGDGDRDEEIERFLFGPRAALPHLRFAVYGVRYPAEVVARMAGDLAIAYRGRLASAAVPIAYSASLLALHVPRRQYVELLPGTPTIRVFEALACGACLVSLAWPDTEHLFHAGDDYVAVRDPGEMRDALAWLSSDEGARRRIGATGRARVLERHTAAHRADELLGMLA